MPVHPRRRRRRDPCDRDGLRQDQPCAARPGARAYGYHDIETLFAFAQDGDLLHLTDAPGLAVTGPFGNGLKGADNLVLRAQAAFARLIGQGGAFGFTLDKRLPVAAGIGGGSADAAAALRLLCGRCGIEPTDAPIQQLAAALGADVPACLLSRPVRGVGRGDRLDPAIGLVPGQPLLLVNPGIPLATAPVFAGWDRIDRGALAAGDAMAAAKCGRNDLEAAAVVLVPLIEQVLATLRAQPGAELVRMSGSGATCFALFEDEASRDAAALAVGRSQPSWWHMASRLR